MKAKYILLLLFFTPIFLLAQNPILTGIVIDENNLGMPGATVVVQGENIGAITDVNGNFTIDKLAEGTYTLEVNYLGYNDFSMEYTHAENNGLLYIPLTPGVLMGDEVLILGDRLKGQAKALNQQRSIVNVTNIVSADQIGRFPDANIGDAMKRIPGITMQGDQGEARNIIVRGLAPQLNSVTLNGDRIPSAEGDNRNIQMDLIPADMIQTIVVNKAVTPDMDGDAIGGSINLITRGAPNDTRLSATLASGTNLLTKKPNITGGLIFGDRFANDKLGLMIAASYNNNDFGSDNMEAEWDNEAESPLTEEDIEVDPYLTDLEMRQYLVQRVRRSLNANLDYRINNNHTIQLRGMYNWRDDRENRFVNAYTDIEPIFEDGTENIVGFEGIQERETKGGIDNNRNRNRRLEDQRIQYAALSGNHNFGFVTMDWVFSADKASEERLNERYILWETSESFDLNHDVTDPRFPLVTAANSEDNAVNSNIFELGEITEENQYTEENDLNFALNLSRNFNIGVLPGQIKFGGKYRSKNKFRDNDFFEFSPINDLAIGDTELKDITKDNFLPGDKYDTGLFSSEEYLGNLDLNNENQFEKEEVLDEYLPTNYEAEEVVTSGYIMYSQDLSSKLQLLAGVRVENTSISYLGNVIEDSEELIEQVTGEQSYTNFLPGAHLRYRPSVNTVIRAAWTNTLARPNYYDLVPYQDVIEEDEEIFRGNPDLQPTTSMNVDVSIERYFTSVGMMSVGAFYKNIDGFTYILQSEDDATGFDLFQAQNGGNADLYGAELTFQRQLDFLPGALKGLGVYANYTYIYSTAEGIRNEDGELREGIALPGSAPHMANGSLSYETKKFVVRASVNYSGSYIDELGDSEFYDRYYDEQLFLDVNASYAITPSWRIFAEANNLTNQPLRYYQGTQERTMQTEYYNSRINIGIKYDFFK